MSSPDLAWVKQNPVWNTSTADDRSNIAVDSNGNSFFAFTRGVGSATSGFIRVIKCDSSGEQLWQYDILTSGGVSAGYARIPSIVVDSNGDVIVAFYTSQNVNGITKVGTVSVALIKLSGTSGSVVWTKLDSEINTSTGNNVNPQLTIDSSDNLYLLFFSNGAITGTTAVGGFDVVVAKLANSTGSKIWIARDSLWNLATNENVALNLNETPNIHSSNRGSNANPSKSIAVDNTGKVYFTFLTLGAITGGTQTNILGDKVIVCLNNDGTTSWTKQSSDYNTNWSQADYSAVISVTPDGQHLYLTCMRDVTESTAVPGGTNSAFADVAVFKINKDNGNRLWSRQDPAWNNSSGYDSNPTSDIDNDGNIYVAFTSTISTSDIKIIKLNSSGDTTWIINNNSFNTSDFSEYFPSIKVKSNDLFYLSYATAGTIEGGTATGQNDMAIAKFGVDSAPAGFDPISITLDTLINPTILDASDGSISISVTGGSGNYTYSWSSGQTTQDITDLSEGSYTVTVTDDQTPTPFSETATYILYDPITITSNTLGNPSFNNVNDGSITITVDGGNNNYTFSWTGPSGFTSSNQNLTALYEGSYTVDISDNSGNEISTPETFVLTGLSIAISITNATISHPTTTSGADGSILLDVSGGNGSYTFSWSGPSGFTSSSEDITSLSAGSYSVDISDSSGNSSSFSYALFDPIFVSTSSIIQPITSDVCGSIFIDVSGGNGDYSYVWFKNDVSGYSSQQDISGAVGTYKVIVSDSSSSNFIEQDNTFIIYNPISITNATLTNPNFGNNGAISIDVSGGNGSYTFSWSGPSGFTSSSEDITALSSGSYSIDISDSSGNSNSFSYILYNPIIVSSSSITPTTTGFATGTISVNVSGGNGVYTYSWSGPSGFTSSSEDITGLSAGLYLLNISDSSGNTSTTYGFNVGSIAPISITNATLTSPNFDNNGAIEIDVSGGNGAYTFSWTGPSGFTSSSEDIFSLSAGSYSVDISDSSGNSNSFSYILYNPIIVSSSSKTNAAISGSATGAVSVDVSGGNGVYTYSWTGPSSFTSSSEDITGLISGFYYLDITDSSGNSSITYGFNVTNTNSVSTSNPSAWGLADGSITLTLASGWSFSSWTKSYNSSYTGSGNPLSSVLAGIYTTTLTDTSSNNYDVSFTLTNPALNQIVSPARIDSSLVIFPPYGQSYNFPTAVYYYAVGDLNEWGGTSVWSKFERVYPNGNKLFYSGPGPVTSTTNYKIYVFDRALTSGELFPPWVVDTADYNGSMIGSIQFTGAPSYYWNLLGHTAADKYRGDNIYPVIRIVTNSITPDIFNDASNGSINLTTSSDNTQYGATITYAWTKNGSSIGSTEDITNSTAGTYELTMRDSFNFQAIQSYTIDLSLSELNSVLTSYSQPTALDASNGSIDITITNLTTGNVGESYSYAWTKNGSSLPDTTQDISGSAGVYVVTITDPSGIKSSSLTIGLFNPIFISDSSYTLVSVNDASDATITVDISGGNSVYTSYSWTKNGISYPDVSTNLTNLTSGVYVLTSVADASNSYFITTGNTFTIPNPPVIPPGSNFGNPTIPSGTVITFPAGVSEELVFTEPSGANLTNAINNIISISTDATLISKLQTGTNIVLVTLEPSGTTFSEYIGIPLTISSTSGLFVFYASGPSAELVPVDTPNYTDGPYYTVVNSGEIMAYTKHFSEFGFGNESGGVGDPFIKPIFGDAYYLPNDESTYLLLDNNSNLKIYTKTWIPSNLKKEMSFMRYLVFDYNFERFCLDLDSMNFVSLSDFNRYITHRLTNSSEPDINGLSIDRTQYTSYFNDYYGKNYKVSGKNKQMILTFKSGNNSEIILQINSDLKYADIRNNVNIKFVNIPKEQIKQFNGAFINEQKVKIIPHNSIVNKKTTIHKF